MNRRKQIPVGNLEIERRRAKCRETLTLDFGSRRAFEDRMKKLTAYCQWPLEHWYHDEDFCRAYHTACVQADRAAAMKQELQRQQAEVERLRAEADRLDGERRRWRESCKKAQERAEKAEAEVEFLREEVEHLEDMRTG